MGTMINRTQTKNWWLATDEDAAMFMMIDNFFLLFDSTKSVSN